MRRFLAFATILLAAGCGSDLLAPVQTVDGLWSGLQNGYSMSLDLTQSGTAVTGQADFAGVGGFVTGTAVGTFNYPDLELTISVSDLQDVTYKGTMSSSQAKITGRLNGSGFDNLELDVAKKK